MSPCPAGVVGVLLADLSHAMDVVVRRALTAPDLIVRSCDRDEAFLRAQDPDIHVVITSAPASTSGQWGEVPVLGLVAGADARERGAALVREGAWDYATLGRDGDVATRVRAAARAAAVIRARDEARQQLAAVTMSLQDARVEGAALQQVAVMVAQGCAPGEVFTRVCSELVAMMRCDGAHIVFREQEGTLTVVGLNSAGDVPHTTLGARVPEDEAIARAVATGVPTRFENAAAAFPFSAAVPVFVDGEVWGGLGVVGRDAPSVPPGTRSRLHRFAELVALAIVNAHAHQATRRLVMRDHLTGLLNRRAFEERVDAEAVRADRHGIPLSLVMVDIDHFKRINDTFGHATGDATLVEVARRLQQALRRGESVARVGGEEFAVLLPHTDRVGAGAAAERLRAAIAARPFPFVGDVTVSLGAAQAPRPCEVQRLSADADAALYRAKEGGRNRVEVDPAPVDVPMI